MHVPSSSQWLNHYPSAPDADYRIEVEADRAAKKANNSLENLSKHADPESRYAARELDDIADFARDAIESLQDFNKDLKERLASAGELNENLVEQLSDVLAFFNTVFVQFANSDDEDEFINWCRLFLKGNWEYNVIPETSYRDKRLPPLPIRGFLLLTDESDRMLYKMRWD